MTLIADAVPRRQLRGQFTNSDIGTGPAVIPIVITAAPAFDSSGRRLPDRFDALLSDDRLLVRGTKTPFLDGARVLLELGFDPGATVIMKHAGSDTECLRARIGRAAHLTVEECTDGRPRFRPFRPRPSEGSAQTRKNENSERLLIPTEPDTLAETRP